MKVVLGTDRLLKVDPATVAEDFGKYGRTEEKVKIALFWCGSVNQLKFDKAQKEGTMLPGLHNPAYYPDFEPTYRTGVAGMCAAMIDLFNNN